MGNSSSYSKAGAVQFYLQGSKHFGRAGFQANSLRFNAADDSADLSGQHIIVTGANRGLGRSMALELSRRRATLHLVCRSREKGEAVLAELRAAGGSAESSLHIVDLTLASEVKRFAAEFEAQRLPLSALILNAGFIAKEHSLTSEGLEPSWATAALQSFLLTGLLLPALARGAAAAPAGRSPGARVVHVSSGGGLTVRLDVADPQALQRAAAFDGALQYAHAKRAQMMLAARWAPLAAAKGIGSYSMHPGWADTPGVQESLPEFRQARVDTLRSEQQGADTAVWLAAAPVLPAGSSGQLFFDRAPAKQHFFMAGTASSAQEEQQLWESCEKASGWAWKGFA
jgi:dehydrogenase/reductase SDR family protein 12